MRTLVFQVCLFIASESGRGRGNPSLISAHFLTTQCHVHVKYIYMLVVYHGKVEIVKRDFYTTIHGSLLWRYQATGIITIKTLTYI